MNDNSAQNLRTRFPRELVKSRPKGGGRLSYIPGERIIERLLDVLGPGGWSWEILAVELMPDGALVRGRLSVLGGSVDGVDYHEFSRAKGGDSLAPEAMANAVKSADTGALVRAARLLGVGLELWHDGEPAAAESPTARPASEGELMACRASAAMLGWDDDGLDAHVAQADAYSQPLTSDGARRLRYDLAMLRARRVRGELGLSAADFVERVGGDPRKMKLDQLEERLAEIEREAAT